MKNVFQQIADELPHLPGWCDLEKAHALASAVLALRPQTVVEVGVFGGKSLLPMALACQAVGQGVCYAIDPWTNAAAVDGYDGENREWWAHVNLEQVYQGFLANVTRLGLGNRVVVQRVKSDDVRVLGQYDLAHLDGQHTDQAVRDVQKFAAAVRVGGLCCLDDIAWVNPASGTTVATAVVELRRLGFVELYRLGTGAMYQRVTNGCNQR